MSTRQISIAFQTNKTPAEYIALAKLVSEYPFDMVSVYCDAPFHPSYGPLILMAPHIRKARLGPAAISPFRMAPIDIAASTALLSGLAAGGVYIGLARGAWLLDHGIREPSRPLQAIREAVGVIRKLLSGEAGGIEGHYFRLAQHVRAPYPLPESKVPLLIGTWGQKLGSLAGELADAVKIGGSANPDMLPVMREAVNTGAKKAGRTPADVALVMGAVTVADEDREAARQAAKQAVALYLPVVAPLDPTVSMEPELLARVQADVEQGTPEKAARWISDELLEKFAFAGDANDLVRQAESLFAAGAARVEFGTPHGLDPARGIRLIGEQVLPRLGK